MASLPPMSGLTAFFAATRHGTLSGAAAELNVTQPAISRRIAALEDDLGCRLFDRGRKPARLTEEGRELMAVLRSSFGRIEDLAASLRDRRDKRIVTILGPSGFVAYWLIPRLGQLEAAIPGVAIRILSQDQGEFGRSADISIRFGLPDPGQPGETKILGEEVYPVASPLYIAQRGLDPNAPDFSHATLLTMESGRRRWYDWPAWFEAAELSMPARARLVDFNSYAMLVNAALAGQGVALSWAGLLGSFHDTGALIRLGGPSVASPRGYLISARDGHAARREAREVLDWIVAQDPA